MLKTVAMLYASVENFLRPFDSAFKKFSTSNSDPDDISFILSKCGFICLFFHPIKTFIFIHRLLVIVLSAKMVMFFRHYTHLYYGYLILPYGEIHSKQNNNNKISQKSDLIPGSLNLASVPHLQSEQTAAGCCLSVIMRREDFSKGYSSEAVVHKHCLMEARSRCYDRYTLETGV